MYSSKNNKQSGAVSLFVVIFATLLFLIITVSFIQLMLKDQQQATVNDLSQSAHDSAQAGVEDAKRLLLLNQACQNGTSDPGVNCTSVRTALQPVGGTDFSACDTLVTGGLVTEQNGETIIRQSTTDGADALDQAYTCVKIATDTADYINEIQANQSVMIPLRGVSDFNKVELSWFSRTDLPGSTATAGFPSPVNKLPQQGSRWPDTYPPLMRAQLIQVADSFSLGDFDDSNNANTMFLFPSTVGSSTVSYSAVRNNAALAPVAIACNANLAGGGYACKATINLPNPEGGNASNRRAFLRLSALYNKAHFSLSLLNNASEVNFDNVQPEVDSTGRANDLFRRVKARVELKGDFTYPEAEIDLTGNLCKNFTVTDQNSGYVNNCTP